MRSWQLPYRDVLAHWKRKSKRAWRRRERRRANVTPDCQPLYKASSRFIWDNGS